MANFLEPIMKKLLKRTDPQPGANAASGGAPASPLVAASPVAPADQGGEGIALTHVWTDAPNAVKLKINRMLLPLGEARVYEQPQQAAEAPLAQALFALEGVTSVELESAMITVFMDEDADWDAIIEKIPPAINAHFASGEPAVKGAEPAPEKKKFNFGFKQVESRPREEQMQIVRDLLDSEINPAVASHGGFFTLIDVKDNNVYVKLGGGCQGCGMADVTLRQGVEQRMKEVLPEMVALIDTTDHASGNNPYYSPGK